MAKTIELPTAVAGELRLTLYLPPCPACDGSNTVVLRTAGPLKYCKCRECQHAFRVVTQSSKALNRLIREHLAGSRPPVRA